MAPSKILGQVPSLFPHVKPDWWKEAYNHVYLWADGDCVEDPAITDEECQLLLNIPRVQNLLVNPSSATSSPVRVLDLCCGQGRHTINLARRLPSVQFMGVDHSEYLISIAKKRAQEIQDAEETRSCHTEFQVGDARQIPAEDGKYDLVILLGNSFGHGSYEDDLQMLRESYRVLKPGGVFVLDCVDGGWMRENSTSSGWEWLGHDSHFLSDPEARGKQLVVLRERELSADGRRLASREIVIDLQGPAVHQDLFYAVQLYDMHEMEGLLRRAGLCKQSYESSPVTAPNRDSGSQRAVDMGMMEHRQLLVAVKPDPLDPQDADTYIHPSVVQDYDPRKGRLVRVAAPVPAGTVIMADAPYALVPAVPPGATMRLSAAICSVVGGYRATRPHVSVAAGQALHDFECAWLKKHGNQIRQEESEDELAMLWVIMRMLAGRLIESDLRRRLTTGEEDASPYLWSGRFKRGFQVMEAMRGNQEAWPDEKIARWRDLIQKYLHDQRSDLADDEELLSLICKEESNSFGLYRGATGLPDSLQAQQRGAQYGLACYPRETLCNHSCVPNLKHDADEQGRMVLTTTRDIAADEECCISYFDLTVHVDLSARRKRTRELFTFSCTCERCLLEEAEGLSK
ncbi:S-adenosyl-L-methionine-dependent methyltransferase [Aspergillus similis]